MAHRNTALLPTYFILHVLSLVINCTALMVNSGDVLRMSSCSSHYGAQCNFSCPTGYRLNGSSEFTCVAPRNQHPRVWNNSLPTCESKCELRLLYNFYSQKLWRLILCFLLQQSLVQGCLPQQMEQELDVQGMLLGRAP